MKKLFKKSSILSFVFLISFLFMPTVLAIECTCGNCEPSFFQSCVSTCDACCAACSNNPGVDASGVGGTNPTGSQGGGGSISLQDPLGITDPREIIKNVINAMLGLVGSLALAVFIFGGFTWVISGGSEEKIKKGKDMVMWAALGLMLIFTSYALINVVLSAVGGGMTGGTTTATGAPQQVGGGDAQQVGGD